MMSNGLMNSTASDNSSNVYHWDVFICHASEDKEPFVRELAENLRVKGIKVWYDEFTLKMGDSLRRSIDEGLAKSKYGVVILSHSFFNKEWPQKELDGLATRERRGANVILPVWFNVEVGDVSNYSPTLAGCIAAKAKDGMEKVINQILEVIMPDISRTVVPEKDKGIGSLEAKSLLKTKSSKKSRQSEIGPMQSTIFFYERVCNAFPGIR